MNNTYENHLNSQQETESFRSEYEYEIEKEYDLRISKVCTRTQPRTHVVSLLFRWLKPCSNYFLIIRTGQLTVQFNIIWGGGGGGGVTKLITLESF